MSNFRKPDTPAPAEVRRMLEASIGVEVVADYLVNMRRRADEKTGCANAFTVTAYCDGNGSVLIGSRYFGGLFSPLSRAFADAEAWLAQDDRALVNETIGLTSDGRFRPRLAVVEG